MTTTVNDDLRAASTAEREAKARAPSATESASDANQTPGARMGPLSLREDDCAALRPMVADVESELVSLLAQADSKGYAQTSARLAESWHRLVAVMALGTAPELRTCPHCKYRIRRQATRCIQCWKQSTAAAA
jgi:hypothetical protein